MRRYKANKRRDKKYFSRTAGSTQKINLQSSPMRGGFRL